LRSASKTRPWGFWGPILKKVHADDPNFKPNPDFFRDMFNIVVGIVWQTSLVAMPIFHIGGSGWGVMGLYHGAKGVIAREFDATKVLDFFEQSGITKLFMVPAAMQFVVRQPRARSVDFSRLKYMLYGASPIPAALLKECIEVFKCGFVQMYGMTETTGTIVALPPEDRTGDRYRRALAVGICRVMKRKRFPAPVSDARNCGCAERPV